MTGIDPTEAALRAACVAVPDDDNRRRRYFDHLEAIGWPLVAKVGRHQLAGGRGSGLAAADPAYDRLDDWLAATLPRFDHWYAQFAPINELDRRYGTAGIVRLARGLVDQVNVTAAWWMEHGRAAVRAHPIQAVFLCDRKPAEFSDAPYVWDRDMSDYPEAVAAQAPTSPSPSHIPGPVFDRMTGETGGYYPVLIKHSDRRYPTRAAADLDLSRAAVAWARLDLSWAAVAWTEAATRPEDPP